MIRKIFQEHAAEYLRRFGEDMPGEHRKVLRAVMECRTGDCGAHVFECPDCGEHHVANSSCGNRHCPLCQNEKAAEWVAKQQEKLLPCTYFMATFTVPDDLRAMARSNQRKVYRAMMREAASSLKELEADPRFIGCDISGFFGVLHTWSRQMEYHPHVHFVIAGGGLDKTMKWRGASSGFLVHVKALSRLYRGKMKAALAKAGLIDQTAPEVWQKDWVVHCEAVGSGREAMKYLGAYVFRVAISNSRMVKYDGSLVTFKYQKVGSSKWKFMTLGAIEFIRRFLQHVLPKGFVKIRHYGFMSPNCAVSIQRIRELICVIYEQLRNKLMQKKPVVKMRPLRCRRCHAVMEWKLFIRPMRASFLT